MTQQLSNIHPLFHINGGAKPGCVSLVGAGPGDPDLLTVKALRLIEQRQVVVSNAARVHETAEALRSEFGSEILAPWNITVNAFCPGIIESGMWDYNDRVWG